MHQYHLLAYKKHQHRVSPSHTIQIKLSSCLLIIKPTRCNNFSNLFSKWDSTCFWQFLCSSSGVFHCAHNNGIYHTGLLTACEQDQDVPSWSCSKAVHRTVWHLPLLCVRWRTPDDEQRNCPKHVEIHVKNKFEKLVHLVGFIIRIYHDARSGERQTLCLHFVDLTYCIFLIIIHCTLSILHAATKQQLPGFINIL
jgi:hypothetical protein